MGGNKKTFTMLVHRMRKEKEFRDFSEFMEDKLLDEGERKELDALSKEEKRRRLYKLFRIKTGRHDIATQPTMKRWFGIGGTAVPNREQIYEVGFRMGLSSKEVQEYLLYGIYEPAFQVTDYRETIFTYGLDNQLSYEQCLDHIEEFERKLDEQVKLEHTCGTQMLLGEYEVRKYYPWNEFCDWMLENAGDFKGYSKTTLKYFQKYRKIILDYVKKDAQEELKRLLEETDYADWCHRRKLDPKEKVRNIKKYIQHREHVHDTSFSEEWQKNVLEVAALADQEKETNQQFLVEVYANDALDRDGKPIFASVHGMTEKHLSDLMNIATHKERMLYIRKAARVLEEMGEDNPCPDWIHAMGLEYDRNPKELLTVAEAKQWITKYYKENRRRCRQIQRTDMLPLVLYVAQRRYQEMIHYDTNAYRQQDALEVFEKLAESTLTACNMCPLDERYELDAVLKMCYQKDEMYSFSELLEIV